MRRIFATILFFLAVIAGPAFAAPCSIDGPSYDGDMAFVPCPLKDTNNGLLDEGYNSARLEKNITLSSTPIFAHNTCRYIDSRGTDAALFIPFQTPTEWLAFLAGNVKGVHQAECCVPRALRPNDVPVPTETCSTGWVFLGLADPADTSKLIASPSGGGFQFTSGNAENASYPIQKLPIARDDVGAQLPQEGLAAYVGKFHCAGTVDFGSSQSPVVLTATTSSSSFSWSQISSASSDGQVFVVDGPGRSLTGRSTTAVSANTSTQTQTGGNATNVTKFMGFTMQCVNNDWRHTSPSCFGKTTAIEVAQCPNGSDGEITRQVIRNCDGSSTTQEISNTCQNKCTPKTITTEERQCPAGKVGKITVEVTKLCFGRKPVSNQSTPGGGENCNCTTTEKIVGDTCTNVCPPSTDIGVEERQCPAGETGKIKVKKTRECHQAEDCGEQQCVCENKETVIENTCKKQCPPSTDLGTETRQCPAGQAGEIVVKKTRECHEERDGQPCKTGEGNQCVCTNKEVVTKNTCKDVCIPSEREETFQCPTGETGSIVKIFRKICDCPGGREEVIVKSNTCKKTCNVGKVLVKKEKKSCIGGHSTWETYDVTYLDETGQCKTKQERKRTKNSCWISPLVLDLDGNGLNLTSLEDSSVKFDMDLDGISDPTAWIGSQEAFLVLDKNNDGVVNNRSEMFGNLDAYENGFSLLATYDDNADGMIDQRDFTFGRLRLWIDNGDGVSQPEELVSLASMDITSINLNYTTPNTILKGNLLGQESSFTYGSGVTHSVFDVWFSVDGSKLD